MAIDVLLIVGVKHNLVCYPQSVCSQILTQLTEIFCK